MQYKRLTDTAKNKELQASYRQILSPGDVRVWYARPFTKVRMAADPELFDYLRDLRMGPDWMKRGGIPLPTPNDIWRSHVKLGSIVGLPAAKQEQGAEVIFAVLQAGNWSPKGEARSLIGRLGLGHTSMSVGDIVHFPDGRLWMVDTMGFKQIWPRSNPRKRGTRPTARKNPDARAILRRAMRGT